ncbi:uncharacterized protein LAJ45_07191 [Morchella importuna]|uniref:uncharacterized protein n=1 Tax=Morchella importuna TaxID=1174673 RepID=UPI001E8E74D0|nr:uncharacterized protein LAJ45_07191 [Morchella importuna]KAH8148848.1 hypothetical protein LAJ45_07191 [Morchella importuna]
MLQALSSTLLLLLLLLLPQLLIRRTHTSHPTKNSFAATQHHTSAALAIANHSLPPRKAYTFFSCRVSSSTWACRKSKIASSFTPPPNPYLGTELGEPSLHLVFTLQQRVASPIAVIFKTHTEDPPIFQIERNHISGFLISLNTFAVVFGVTAGEKIVSLESSPDYKFLALEIQ